MDESDTVSARNAGSRARPALRLVIDQDAPLPTCEDMPAPQLRLAIDNERKHTGAARAWRAPTSGCPKA